MVNGSLQLPPPHGPGLRFVPLLRVGMYTFSGRKDAQRGGYRSVRTRRANCALAEPCRTPGSGPMPNLSRFGLVQVRQNLLHGPMIKKLNDYGSRA